MADETKRLDLPLLALVLVSGALLSTRLMAAAAVGFGDSEALYASYALHPAPAYLDHPGLIGMVARAIGSGTAPSPHAAHQVTAVLATLVPWLVVLAARAAGAEKKSAYIAGLVVAICPEISVGLFAMTPDLLLAILWLGTLGLAALALSGPPSNRSAACFVGAGLLAGIAFSAKVPGALLFVALICAYFSRSAKDHQRTMWPWAGLALGAIVIFPVVWFEAHTGFPMLRHRLIDTQVGAGPSLRNVGAVVAGQLLYVSPVLVLLAAWSAIDLFRKRHEDAIATLLWFAFIVPFVPLVLLSLWSRVAEPHWIAPALLALPIHAARRPIARISSR
ncbi:MAG: glycosyltransferase family 39 protein, partial [Polyangiaceae bacterium]